MLIVLRWAISAPWGSCFSSPEPKAQVSYCHSAPSVRLRRPTSSSSVNFHIFRAQEPKAPVTYCDHALSGVCRPLDYLHFRLLLQNRLMDFDETWYGWSTQGPLQVLLFFGQIRRGADPGRGKNRSRGVPFFRKLLLQTGSLQQQTECIAVI